jgi:diguanylate cyclase
MRYRESLSQSAECLRLALQHMGRHDAGLHPVSYAVWYEYVAGINPALTAELDGLNRTKVRLNDEMVFALYRRHIAEIDDATAERISNQVQRIVHRVSDSAAQAGERASHFGNALEQLSESLNRPRDAGAAPIELEEVLRDTRDMQDAIGKLQTRLDQSLREAEQLRQEVARAREEALVDALTGLPNRKALDRAMDATLADLGSNATGPCLLMVDIDHFKRINDTYGHLFGDKVLRSIGQILKANVKGRDTAARYGGEEFAVLLPHTPLHGALGLAEALRRTIAGGRVKRLDSDETIGNITVSIGLAAFRSGETAAQLLGRADRALYASKAQGRNRVTVAEDALACES